MTPIAQAGYRRNLRREWLALSLLILLLVAWLSLADGLRRIDHLVQDAGLRAALELLARNVLSRAKT